MHPWCIKSEHERVRSIVTNLAGSSQCALPLALRIEYPDAIHRVLNSDESQVGGCDRREPGIHADTDREHSLAKLAEACTKTDGQVR